MSVPHPAICGSAPAFLSDRSVGAGIEEKPYNKEIGGKRSCPLKQDKNLTNWLENAELGLGVPRGFTA
jgi:hypothetical protein